MFRLHNCGRDPFGVCSEEGGVEGNPEVEEIWSVRLRTEGWMANATETEAASGVSD